MTPAEIDDYLCRVCALPSGQVTDALEYLGAGADVLSLDPCTLKDVLATIIAVGERAGAAERAAQLVAGLRERLAAVAARVTGRPRPRVAVLEWTDPPFAAGHWIPDLVTAVAGSLPDVPLWAADADSLVVRRVR
jgi:iron complex transport system substrate-binding protein